MRTPARASKADALASAAVVCFSFLFLAASFAVFSGLVPLSGLDPLHQAALGGLLFFAPVLTLILAMILEASRLVLRDQPLPEPVRPRAIVWDPGRR